jgi:hypothetical protein
MKTVMIILSMITAAMLTSCAADPHQLARNLPANYKTVATNYVMAHLKDSASCTYLRVSDAPPIQTITGFTGVTVWANAKNSFGGYVGISPITVYFKNGAIVYGIE